MKLLIDENLSFRLAAQLAADYPGSTHVRDAGLRGASDDAVWDFAREHGFSIVSKDNHFRQRAFVEGHPPKIVWLDVGNAGTAEIGSLVQAERERLLAFERDPDESLIVLVRVGGPAET